MFEMIRRGLHRVFHPTDACQHLPKQSSVTQFGVRQYILLPKHFSDPRMNRDANDVLGRRPTLKFELIIPNMSGLCRGCLRLGRKQPLQTP